MKKINIGFIILFIFVIVSIVFWVTQINFDNLSFKENSSPYFGISSLLLMSFALKMIKRGIKKK
jgi:hypothetical protein